jgi:hypothetical protein
MRRFNTVIADLRQNPSDAPTLTSTSSSTSSSTSTLPVDPFTGGSRADQVFGWGGDAEWAESDDEGSDDDGEGDSDGDSGAASAGRGSGGGSGAELGSIDDNVFEGGGGAESDSEAGGGAR